MSKPPQQFDLPATSSNVTYLDRARARPERPAPVTDAELAEFRRLLPFIQQWERERAVLLGPAGCPVMKHVLTE